jgi:4-hydroxy-3-methylbut-2-enyl diphosphate reductase
VQIVERAIEKYGSPVYVRHEIVHNKFVVDGLREKGAIFVEHLSEVPDDGQPVIFSAHGVPKSVPREAKRRKMFFIDATCPLVGKVHREAERHYKNGDQVILIGHAGHPEVVGTMGQVPDGAVLLVENIDDVSKITGQVRDPDALAFCTQTTLSVDDTTEIISELQRAFPNIKCPKNEDICYATTNRQAAMKAIAHQSDVVMVLGAPNSSNSNRLVEVAALNGCSRAMLVRGVDDIDWGRFKDVHVLGLSAGASAPEVLITDVIEKAGEHFNVELEEVAITQENVTFKLPKVLA